MTSEAPATSEGAAREERQVDGPSTATADEVDVSADLGRVPPTGVAQVDAALRRLGDLDALPVAAHPAVVEQVHADLQEALTGAPGVDDGTEHLDMPTTGSTPRTAAQTGSPSQSR
jgi:hypothetical protein